MGCSCQNIGSECPLHAAAPQLLKACVEAFEFCRRAAKGLPPKPGALAETYHSLASAIEAADPGYDLRGLDLRALPLVQTNGL